MDNQNVAEQPVEPLAPQITEALIADAHAHDALVRNARETLAILLALPSYLPTPIGNGLGTKIAAFCYLPLVVDREKMFRNRHYWNRLHVLQPYLSSQEYTVLKEQVQGDDLHRARRSLMNVHRELINLYRLILSAYSETELGPQGDRDS